MVDRLRMDKSQEVIRSVVVMVDPTRIRDQRKDKDNMAGASSTADRLFTLDRMGKLRELFKVVSVGDIKILDQLHKSPAAAINMVDRSRMDKRQAVTRAAAVTAAPTKTRDQVRGNTVEASNTADHSATRGSMGKLQEALKEASAGAMGNRDRTRAPTMANINPTTADNTCPTIVELMSISQDGTVQTRRPTSMSRAHQVSKHFIIRFKNIKTNKFGNR